MITFSTTTIICGIAVGTLLLLGGWAILRRRKREVFFVHEELSLEQVLAAGMEARQKVTPGQRLFAVSTEISKLPVDVVPPEMTQGAKKSILIATSDAECNPTKVVKVLLAHAFAPALAEALQEGGGAIEFVD